MIQNYNYIFANLFPFNLKILSEFQQHDRDSIVLILTSFYGLFAFGVVFALCEVGQHQSDAFEKINDTIDAFDWHLFPREILRLLPIIMIIAQQPVELVCFGSITCCRYSFRKVIDCNSVSFTLVFICYDFISLF